jgi:hypothetical protein
MPEVTVGLFPAVQGRVTFVLSLFCKVLDEIPRENSWGYFRSFRVH